MTSNPEKDEVLYAKINLETAQIPWKELERFFAAGRIISVDDSVDMIQVATLMANDDAKAISDMLENKQIERVTDGQANLVRNGRQFMGCCGQALDSCPATRQLIFIPIFTIPDFFYYEYSAYCRAGQSRSRV